MGGKNSILLELVNEDYTLIKRGSYYSTIEHDSLVIDPKKDLFFWNSQNIIGDSYTYLRKVRGLNHEKSVEILQTVTPFIELKSLDNEVFDLPNEVLVSVFYEYGKEYRDYWHNYRGYTDNTIDKFKLGYTGKYWVIPLYHNSVFKNFQCRGYDINRKKIVCSYYKGICRVPFNFDNLPDKNQTLYITESIVDSIMLIQNNYNSISSSSGTLGWDHKWSNLLLEYRDIIICYDNDIAGINGSLRTSKFLQHNSKILMWPKEYPPKYDVTDLYKDGGSIENLKENFIPSYMVRRIYNE